MRGVVVSATQNDAPTIRVSLSDRVDKQASDPFPPVCFPDNELNDLDLIPRKVVKDIPDDLVLDHGDEEKSSLRTLLERRVGEEANRGLRRLRQRQHGGEVFLTSVDFPNIHLLSVP